MESKSQRLADMIAGMDSPIKDLVPETIKPSMSFDTRKMLEKMNSKLGIKKLMTESKTYETLVEGAFDEEFEIDMENTDDN